MQVRPADISQIEAIAGISVDIWQKSYKGYLSAEGLAAMCVNDYRLNYWRRAITEARRARLAFWC